MQVLSLGHAAQLQPFLGDPEHVPGILIVALADVVVHLGKKQVMIGIHYIDSNAFHGFQIIPLALFVCLRLDLLVPFELVVVEERLVIFTGDRSRIP